MTSSSGSLPTSDEQAVIDAAAAGVVADFSTYDPRPTIPADLIRRLVLGLDVDGRTLGRLPAGVRVKGAIIKGPIDLRGGRLVGGETANGLELMDCEIRESLEVGSGAAVDLREAVIDRLILDYCRISNVDFSSAEIRGDVSIVGLRPAAEEGECWVCGIETRIDGSVIAHGAQLNVQHYPDARHYPPLWYALNLDYARIKGGVWLEEAPGGLRFLADGGVSLEGIIVGMEVAILGATLRVPTPDRQQVPAPLPDWYHPQAVSAKYAVIGGNFWIVLTNQYEGDAATPEEYNCTGGMDLSHARVGGDLELVRVFCEFDGSGLNADNTDVRGDLLIMDVRRADVTLHSARVQAGIQVIAKTPGLISIDLSNAEAAGFFKLRVREAVPQGIDLTGFRCSGLDDDDGLGWAGFPQGRIRVDGFEYGRIVPPSDGDARDDAGKAPDAPRVPEIDLRLEWLAKQHSKAPPSREEFRIQPYEHLARVWRAEGKYGAADRVSYERLKLERRVLNQRAIRWLKLWSLQLPFKYGLSVPRAAFTFLLFIVIGWVSTEIANYGSIRVLPLGTSDQGLMFFREIDTPLKPVLMVETATVSTLAFAPTSAASENGGEASSQSAPPTTVVSPRPATPLADATGLYQSEFACGDQIETLLYAFDVFVPLLDLRQESKCTVSGRPEAWAWRVGKGLYATLGWFVTSGFVLTASGLLRRQVEH